MNNSFLFDTSIDQVNEVLIPHASFLANIENPIAYTESDEGERFYAPHPEILELIIWNVVIAFWINILASHAYERFIDKHHKLVNWKELKNAQEFIEGELGLAKSHETVKGIRFSVGNLFRIEADYVERTTDLLTYYGWPKDKAIEDAQKTFSYF
jgi:hypothetical protein